ncbi:ATP-binding protein [Candidatus Woesearchaeota archaeon]|nr:ATP-binding protein [Candidatus Woesearchaeota archaeon]
MIKLLKHNLHWGEGFYFEYKRKRRVFDELVSYLPKKQIIAITGLRRTGKTVLLKQLINHLIENEKVARNKILYFSFDEEKPEIDLLLQEYAAVSGISLGKEQIFIFLDEIQKLENWQEQIKFYYDSYANIKFFVSGSESLFIRKKSQESLAGRIYILELPVLSFIEFLEFNDKHDFLKNPAMFKEEIKTQLLSYMRRNFIEVIAEDEQALQLYLEGIINKIVYEDIPSIFPIDNPEKLKAILKAIYSNPGMLVHYGNLASDFGISSKTVEKYVFYLLQSKLIKKIYNYSRNFLTSEKKLKKAYVTAPCFSFLNENYDITKIAENIVALHNNINFFWRDSFKNEVDFIIKKDNLAQAVEVKYTNKITKNDIKSLLRFLEKFKLRNAVIVTEDYEAEELINNNKIKYIPLWKWLLFN